MRSYGLLHSLQKQRNTHAHSAIYKKAGACFILAHVSKKCATILCTLVVMVNGTWQ